MKLHRIVLPAEDWAKLLNSLLADPDWWKNRDRYAALVSRFSEGLEAWMAEKNFENIISKGAEVSSKATLTGKVIVDIGATISSGAVIAGPAYIGPNCEIGPNCYLTDGVYVGAGSCIGQGAEVKSSVLIESARIFHFSYIGHSIIGKNANLAAGVITSVRRFDGRPVKFHFPSRIVGVEDKGGAMVANGAQIGCGTIIFPGRQVGPDVQVLPGSRVTENILVSCKAEANHKDSEAITTSAEQLWISCMSMWDKEADRFWVRSNVFLVVNSALLAFLGTQGLKTALVVITSVFGVALCFLWWRVNVIGKYYLDRWKKLLIGFETQWPVKPITSIEAMAESDDIPGSYEASTTYMQWVIQLFGIVWTFIFGYALLCGFK